jgi:uncharacterized protein (UPF0332 family)
MDKGDFIELSNVRLESAKQNLNDAKQLLLLDSYKSANNRAFYAVEKAIKALLAIKSTDASTHHGVLVLFNKMYIQGNEGFTSEDYKIILETERIRNVSDYDDFYIANKEETKQQVMNAEYFVDKVTDYLNQKSS